MLKIIGRQGGELLENNRSGWKLVQEVIGDVHSEELESMAREYLNDLAERESKKSREEQGASGSFKETLEQMSEHDLRIFVPDVYQKDIYRIDYEKLKASGIKLLSFDIDDTIDDVLLNNIRARVSIVDFKMPRKAKELFQKLKAMGFTVTLITNAIPAIAEGVHAELGTDNYIARAEKPETASFDWMLSKYGLEKSQMAHIGNSMRDDVAGGNKAGITTCLVRRAGWSIKVQKQLGKMVGHSTKGHLIRKRLGKYGIWHKHHIKHHGDQYYQLGEVQKYSPNFHSVI